MLKKDVFIRAAELRNIEGVCIGFIESIGLAPGGVSGDRIANVLKNISWEINRALLLIEQKKRDYLRGLE